MSKAEIHSDDHPAYSPAFQGTARAGDRAPGDVVAGQARTARNPLVPSANLADLLLRHTGANHKRETIAFSKRRQGALYRAAIWLVWRNYVKSTSENQRDDPPGVRIGVVARRLTVNEILRQREFPWRVNLGDWLTRCYFGRVPTRRLRRLSPEGGNSDDMRRLFGFALSALGMLARRTPDARLRAILELRALDALGLRPELRHCVRCGRELREGRAVGFHVPDGGPICPDCAPGQQGVLPVHLGTLRALEQGLRLDLDRLDRLVLTGPALEEARRLVTRFQRFHVGVALQSEAFLDQMLGGNAPPTAAPPDALA